MILLDFNTWWSELQTIEQIYWAFAIPSSLVFLITLVLTFVGGDVDDAASADADIDGDHGIGFQFFTLKNLIGFFTVFSWVGLACLDSGLSIGLTTFISFICGVVMMFLMAGLFYLMGKMVDSGTMNLQNAIGGIGEVYLPIGKNKSSFGKIQINIQGAMRTMQAMTPEDEDLPVGSIVEVKDVINDSILVVVKSTK